MELTEHDLPLLHLAQNGANGREASTVLQLSWSDHIGGSSKQLPHDWICIQQQPC